MDKMALADLIDGVAAELQDAARRAADRPDRVMEFAECEIAVAVEIEKAGKVGVNIQVVDLGGNLSKTHSHTITLKFKALGGMAFPGEAQGDGPALGPARP